MVILSDIQGIEDFLGDMDFKVCGTAKGITALQRDNKARGLSVDILARALKQASEGRAYILDAMLETIAAPREELSEFPPVSYTHLDVYKRQLIQWERRRARAGADGPMGRGVRGGTRGIEDAHRRMRRRAGHR